MKVNSCECNSFFFFILWSVEQQHITSYNIYLNGIELEKHITEKIKKLSPS